jgi:hypothetical protein
MLGAAFPTSAKMYVQTTATSNVGSPHIPYSVFIAHRPLLMSLAPLCLQDKLLFLSLLFPLQSNVHQWKSLWIEFGKVCHKVESMDSLLTFRVQPSGKLRGSPQQDQAFSTL